jgi:predicted Mrr-cat superfamily restriction endonuclease
LITSAAISDSVRKFADEKGIVAMDGYELADWILENLNKLSPETRIRLGISTVPQFSD